MQIFQDWLSGKEIFSPNSNLVSTFGFYTDDEKTTLYATTIYSSLFLVFLRAKELRQGIGANRILCRNGQIWG
jgi:hypothetical protein